MGNVTDDGSQEGEWEVMQERQGHAEIFREDG